MSDFTVADVTLCDFATIDLAGKAVLVGVYGTQIRVPGKFDTLPMFYISLVIEPKKPTFEVTAELVGPNEQGLILVSGKFSAVDPLPKEHRATLNWQTVPVPVTGAGTYSLVVRDKDEVVHVERFEILDEVGTPFKASFGANVLISEWAVTEAQRRSNAPTP